MLSLSRGRHPVPADKPADSEPDALVAAGHSTQASTQKLQTNFMDLPTELHLLISKELTYPDALSLKHTSRYLYDLVDTGVRLKVAWLMERRMLHLDCPNDRKCNLRTDLEFCRGSVTSVPTLLSSSYRSPGLVQRSLTYRVASSCRDVGSMLNASLGLA